MQGTAERGKDELISDVFLWTLTYGWDSVSRPGRTLDVVWKTCQARWMIGTDGEKESGKSELSAWTDEDDYTEIC